MSDAIEEWCPIDGYGGGHEVSDHGRIRSWLYGHGNRRLPLSEPIIRKQYLAGPRRDYWYIDFHWNGNKASKRINVLVLEVFVGPCPGGHVSAHDNGDSKNNRLSNLAWKTVVQNHADKKRHGTQPQGDTHWNAKLSPEQVSAIRSAPDDIEVIMSAYQISRSHAYAIRAGTKWAAS